MQINRTTSRAQTTGTARAEAAPEVEIPAGTDPEAVEGFFDMDVVGEETPPPASTPFDALFANAAPPPGTEALHGLPSVQDFPQVHVVTLDQWLIANPPEARFHINLYIEKLEQKIEEFTNTVNQYRQSIADGELTPAQVRATQAAIQRIESAITIMNQQRDLAITKKGEVDEILQREQGMVDADGDGRIRNLDGTVHYYVGTTATGEPVILEKRDDKYVPVVNPYRDTEYKTAIFSTDNLSIIDRDLRGELDLGQGEIRFDEAFELNGANAQEAALTINHSVTEGVWVEAGDDGEPKMISDMYGSRFNPKPFEQVTREDGETFWGQNPPSDEERENWVFVKATRLSAEHERVILNGEEIDGSYVHFTYEDKDGNTLLRIRVQGIRTGSASPLNTDGTNYVAASTAMVQFDNGTDAEGDPVKHSFRASYIELDATGLTNSTGRSLLADMYDPASIRAFYEELGIPPQTDEFGNFLDVDASDGRPEGLEDGIPDMEYYNERYRAQMAASSTLVGGFINPTGGWNTPLPDATHQISLRLIDQDPLAARFGIDNPYDEEIENPDRTLDTRTAYISEELREIVGGATGIFVKGLRGNILGPQEAKNIILVPPPNPEDLQEMLPFKQDITPDSPAWAAFVDAGRRDSIVVSKGGDLFLRGGTFVWREATPNSRDDAIYMDFRGVNQASEKGNHRLFVHIGDTRPSTVQIANGDDIDPDVVQRADQENLSRDADDVKIPEEVLLAANDDWIEGPALSNFEFSNQAHDMGGLNRNPIDAGAIDELIRDAEEKILDEVINYTMEDNADLGRSAADWGLPPIVDNELGQGNFFDEFGDFFGEENDEDMNVTQEELENDE